jgi:hypothetical protein
MDKAKRSNLKRFEMIKLKAEVNKSAVMRELQAKAIERFKDSWQPELQVQAYMNGAHDLFKLLRLGDVSVSFTDRLFEIAYDYESSVSERMEQIKTLLVNER